MEQHSTNNRRETSQSSVKFVKRQDVVEAVIYTRQLGHPCVKALPNSDRIGWLSTSKGGCAVIDGDYLLKNLAGEWSVMKPEIFEQLYEKVD